jgi:NitT/TauT family transport system substrate-binding protein
MFGSNPCTAALAALLLLTQGLASSSIAQDKPAAKVVLSLDFIPLGRHAPWYAALAEGFFREEGLEVSIIPSQGTAQTIQAWNRGPRTSPSSTFRA